MHSSEKYAAVLLSSQNKCWVSLLKVYKKISVFVAQKKWLVVDVHIKDMIICGNNVVVK